MDIVIQEMLLIFLAAKQRLYQKIWSVAAGENKKLGQSEVLYGGE